ncbi:MAG: serine/threonine protein kinase [Lentisphaerae bacterium]|nr:serine/threonine protein kinase [Lentisphaerota bacterium]
MAAELEEIADRWSITLTRKVAQGGMGAIYEGRLKGAEGFEKKVAVKTLLDRWSNDARFMKLFVAEAKLVCDLVHENIVQIYQLGRRTSGGYYIVMEFVDGLPLRRFLDRHIEQGKRIPEPLAVHIVSRIARGLAYAHTFHDRSGRRLHIVHRDVCLGNVLITTEGLAKLTDFGIAKALPMQIIGDDWLTGKIRYMSPEQAAREKVDFRSDIYSLGAVLFEMLAHETIRPHDADPRRTPFAEIPVPWSLLPKETGAEVVDLLRTALDPDPSKRFQETSEMARALEYYIYKDGYGPTIQTVEAYMRKHVPELYSFETPAPPAGAPAPAVADETAVDEA